MIAFSRGYLLFYLLHLRHDTPHHSEGSGVHHGNVAPSIDCDTGYENFAQMWDEDKKAICCDLYGRACNYHPPPAYHPHYPPPHPPQQYTEYNCQAGYSNWYFGWSKHKKAWCCHHEHRGCPGTWHGSYHLHMHVMHGVGHAHGRIYDCAAGFSNWMQGWSDSKKDWCCSHEHKGCVKYHCNGHVPWRPLSYAEKRAELSTKRKDVTAI